MYLKCPLCGNASKDLFLNELAMRQCVKCSLVWRQNFDLPADHYANKVTDIGSNKLKEREQNSILRLKQFKKHVLFEDVCDVGTGEGVFLKVLQTHGCKRCVGIEPNRLMADFWKLNNLRVFNAKSTKEIVDLIEREKIKVVTLFHVIEHIPDPVDLLSEIRSALPSGGIVVVETPNLEAYSMKKSSYRHKLIYPEHLFYFNTHNFLQMFNKTGFNVVANGKRDFNQNYLGIHECLWRLGLTNNKFKVKNYSGRSNLIDGCENINSVVPSVNLRPVGLKKNSIRFLNFILSQAVQVLGRLDYQWVIAKKIST